MRGTLRFLAQRLDLSETQVAEMARLLDELKTERAQAAVDDRRAVSGFADALAGEGFDEARVRELAQERVRIAERLRDAVLKVLGRTHGLLSQAQRAQLAYLLRTGVLTI